MDEILKIIINANKERRLLDTPDVKKICDIVIKKNKYNFINDVIMAKKHPYKDNCAGSFASDKIIFFKDGILKYITEYADYFSDSYSIDGATVDVLNYSFLTLIFHELAHARQHYLINCKYDSFEKRLFSFFFELGKDRDFYDLNYDNDLTEINANNVSHITANYFYNKLPNNFVSPSDKTIYQLSTMKMLLQTSYEVDPVHEITCSPAERIASSFNDELLAKTKMNIDKYAKLIYNNNFTIYKKLMLGLPISYLEYAYANLLIDELNAGVDTHALKKIQKRL